MSEKSIFTEAVHAGEEPEKHHGAINTPVYHTAIFGFTDIESGERIHNFEEEGYFYSRLGNPTQTALEKAAAQLEKGEDALAFSSGMAAISSAVMSMVRSGDRIVAPESLYAATRALFNFLQSDWGVDVVYVDATHAENYRAAVSSNTRLVYIETPSNPTLRITDIAAVSEIAAKSSIPVICDNTFATPFNQNPLSLGATAVVHSATKYFGGHSDLSAGLMVGSSESIERARHLTARLFGGAIAPATASLVLRGIKTLPLRVERHNCNALAVAGFLENHPAVTKVNYPGLESHPQHALAIRQMRGFGGMLSFDVGSEEKARRLVNKVRLCTLASSLGSVETIIQHSVSMTDAKVSTADREKAGITSGLIRLSVGIEDAGDIIEDLKQALD
jgi:methionine-gamma-lyase